MTPTELRRRRWLAIGLLLVGLIGSALGMLLVRSWRVERSAREARQAFREGRLDDAETALNDWLHARPRSAEAHFLKARVLFGQKRFEDVSAELERARALGYPELPIERIDGLLMALSGRSVQAEPLLAHVLTARPGTPDPEVDEALARILLSSYKIKEAAVLLERWRRDAPEDPRPYLWQTEVDVRLGADTDVTAAHYREALRRDPTLDEARLGLAETLREGHLNEEAARAYDDYIAHKPEDPAGHIGAGRNALEQGQLDQAAQHLERALKLDPDNTKALREMARVELQQGAFEAALQRLDRALKLDPFDRELWHARGLTLARLGRTDEAREAQQHASQLRQDESHLNEVRERLLRSPNDPELQYEIARWMFEHGHDDGGLQWARRVLSVHPGHPPTCRLLADYYDRNGEPGRANYYRLQAGGSEGDEAPASHP